MKTVAITGTTRGIGQALKQRFESSHVVVSLNRPEHDLENIATLNVDFTNTDVLILNAGPANNRLLSQDFISQPASQWQSIVQSQLFGNLHLLQQYLQQRQQGVVVLLSSVVVEQSRYSGRAVYTAAKTALSTMIDELRHEVKRSKQQIRLLDIRPGLTRDSDEMPEDGQDRRPTTYTQVADAIFYAVEHPTINTLTFNNL